MSARFDLVIVGGGTAALVAALGAAGIGARVALVEAERVGGDCLWTGCVPSKALLAAAGAAQAMRTAGRFGLEPCEPQVDLARVMAEVRRAQQVIEPQDSPERLRAAGVEVVFGRGRFDGAGQVVVEDRVLRYRTALIATGSRPVVPPIEGLADAAPLTSDTVWDLDRLPARLVVLGGGAIGCELGQAFARLGTAVTIVESQDRLLATEDPRVGRLVAERMRAEGVAVRTGTTAAAVGRTDDGWSLTPDDGPPVPFDRILVATGRRARTDGLGLETVGVRTTEQGDVVVDERLRTTGDRIYAAGDVTGAMPFTHVAAHHGRLVVTNALLRTRRRARHDEIPWVTFTDPEVARVGLDATAARARWGGSALVQRYDHAELDRAVTEGATLGYTELVGDPGRRLVGATVVGHRAGESIAELTAWLVNGARIDRISTTVHAYPTMAEGAARAADDVLRGRFFTPRVRRFTVPALRLLRRLDAAG